MTQRLPADRIRNRNFFLNVAEGALFSSSSGFISSQTVLPAIVIRLGGGNIAVGAIGVITWLGLFLPQIFAARYVQAQPWKKPWAIRFGLLQRLVMLLLALSVWIFAGTQPHLALMLFFTFFALNQIMLGITTPGWFEMFAKLISTKRRGRLTGLRSSLGGVGALICGLLLTWFLAAYDFPLNYSLAIFCAFLLQVLSIVVQLFLVEGEPSVVNERVALASYLSELPRTIKENRHFKTFLVSTVIQIIAAMPVGFYTVHALRQFSADESIVGEFTLAMVAVQVVSSLGIGFLTDKYGNKVTLVIAASALFLANLLALLAPSLGWFIAVYIFLGINLGTELLARYNIAIEYGPPEQRATYVGLMNTFIAPFYFAGVIGGVLIDTFSYTLVLGIGIVSSAVGLLVLIFKVREPRHVVDFASLAP